MSGLANLPKAKWSAAGKQPGLKPDMVDIERGILESFELRSMPQLISVDATAVKVSATADSPARLMMAGFPDVLHPGQFLPAGLSDGKYRANTGDVAMDFDVAANRWGTEKASQWYAIYALAANADTTFTLKAMPWMRYSSQASQVITLRNNLNTANIGYGFTTDELVGGKILILSGASKGLMRSITANNNDNGTAGTITYGDTALTMTQGDSFIVLPPATNFRLLGDLFNNASSNITVVRSVGDYTSFITATWNGWLNPVWARQTIVDGCGGGGGGYTNGTSPGGGGGSARCAKDIELSADPGAFYDLTIGAAGVGGVATAGGTTSFGSLLSLPGGGAASNWVGGASGGDGGAAGQDGDLDAPAGSQTGGNGASGMHGPGGAGGQVTNAGKAAGKYGAGGGGENGAGADGSQGFLSVRTKI